jgi:phosphatidylglycerol:prolipoprotein diacylglycerol transferase
MHPVLIAIGSLLIPSYGVLAAAGVLTALGLAHWTAPLAGVESRHGWNAVVLGVFAALTAQRGLLIALNLGNLRVHPRWLLALALVHHPLLTGVGALAAALAVVWYARWAHVPLLRLGDALAAPVALGMALEQMGCLLAGSDFGRDAGSGAWGAVTYSSTLAERWSGTPLGVPLVPVQAYAALGAVLAAGLCGLWLRRRVRKPGEAAGVGWVALGVVVFLTECLRDWEGRGVIHLADAGGVIDAPQLVALVMVLAGFVLLADWDGQAGWSEKNG